MTIDLKELSDQIDEVMAVVDHEVDFDDYNPHILAAFKSVIDAAKAYADQQWKDINMTEKPDQNRAGVDVTDAVTALEKISFGADYLKYDKTSKFGTFLTLGELETIRTALLNAGKDNNIFGGREYLTEAPKRREAEIKALKDKTQELADTIMEVINDCAHYIPAPPWEITYKLNKALSKLKSPTDFGRE